MLTPANIIFNAHFQRTSFKPRYMVLVDSLYPEEPHEIPETEGPEELQEGGPVSPGEGLTDLMIYAMVSRWKNVNQIGCYILWRTKKDLCRKKFGNVIISLGALHHIIACAEKFCEFFDPFYSLIQTLLMCDVDTLRKFAASMVTSRKCKNKPEVKCRRKVSKKPKLITIVEEIQVWRYPLLVH